MEFNTAGPPETLLLVVLVLVAGVVRGCIGFGFSALVVASTSLFLDPSQVVPLVVLLEITASLQMAFRVWRNVLRELLALLFLGVVLGTPIGVYVLSVVAPDKLRLIISIMIFAMTITLCAGYVYSGPRNRPVLSIVGIVSGLFNGIAGIGGMPVAIFLASAKYSIQNIRATMVMFLLGIELIFVASAAVGELYRRNIVNTFLLTCIPMAAGLMLGSHLFGRLDERTLRRIFLLTLLLLSVIGVIRAAF